jgi:hypothetical protein
MFLRVFRGVDRPHIKNFFPVRIVESLIGEGQRAQNHQQNPSNGERFHTVGSEIRNRDPAMLGPDENNRMLDGFDGVFCSFVRNSNWKELVILRQWLRVLALELSTSTDPATQARLANGPHLSSW